MTALISQADLFAKLAELGVKTKTVDHPPLFTVAESQALRGQIPGGHSKNLFLKDKKGRLFLLIAGEESKVNLKTLHKTIGAARLSFGKAELLFDVLGMTPGAVNPFALMNDRERRCEALLDQALMAHRQINFHPLQNSQTTTIASDDLVRFLRHIGHPPRMIDLSLSGIAP